MNPDKQREILVAEVLSLAKKEQRRIRAKRVVALAWGLAEAQIKVNDGEIGYQKDVDKTTRVLGKTELGKGLLNLKNEMVQSISNDKNRTREGLARYLSNGGKK